MNNWIWIGKFVIVIAAALVLGEVLGSLELFRSTTLGTRKVTGGALVLLWLLGQQLTRQIRALNGGLARLADPVLVLITLIITASAYVVLINFSAALLGDNLRSFLDWMFIFGILAAAVWLVYALFQNSEAVMEAIDKSGKPGTE